MIYSYVNTKEETNVKETVNEEILYDSDQVVSEDLIFDGKYGKGEARNVGKISIRVDKPTTGENYSENNAYFKAINGKGEVIRLNLATNEYQEHHGDRPWKVTASDLDKINTILNSTCTAGKYKGQNVYLTAVQLYNSYYNVNLNLSLDDKPVYKYSTLSKSKSEHNKEDKK